MRYQRSTPAKRRRARFGLVLVSLFAIGCGSAAPAPTQTSSPTATPLAASTATPVPSVAPTAPPSETPTLVATNPPTASPTLGPTAAPGNGKATAIATGWRHTCAVTYNGGVRCWGANDYGQLGNGTTTDSARPVDVLGLASGVLALAASVRGTCALTSGGGVKCWGANDGGQLGDGTSVTNSPTPVNVTGLASGVTAIAAGAGEVCALTGAGGVKCWGWNRFGQHGDGTYENSSHPVDVSGLTSGVIAVSVSALHACALTTGGGVKCWGDPTGGVLNTGRPKSNVPLDVPGLARGVTAIAAGGLHACVIVSPGGVKCWGDNTRGELGNGSTTDSNTPVDVDDLAAGVSALAVGTGDDLEPSQSCALTGAGGAKCWGRNDSGQVGDGSTKDRSTPVDVAGLASGVSAIAVGGSHSCAITTAQSVKCWGGNSNGQLGNGTTTDSGVPVVVSGL